ncbi:hypothetical protein [Bradyrhizobium centrolobii]|uniref:hypothetical protein n=1 Tax=Bradyrhizobium centrolobii TaxID=1505087 RepID=UPI0013747159|nr:hypothetical protein [Bradyrhizobium centrolobii]
MIAKKNISHVASAADHNTTSSILGITPSQKNFYEMGGVLLNGANATSLPKSGNAPKHSGNAVSAHRAELTQIARQEQLLLDVHLGIGIGRRVRQ